MSVPRDLVDARGIAARYGVERSTAERIMRTLTVYRVPGVRRAYVSARDVEQAWHDEIVAVYEARIERAARALHVAYGFHPNTYDDLREVVKDHLRNLARVALAAADQEDTDA